MSACSFYWSTNTRASHVPVQKRQRNHPMIGTNKINHIAFVIDKSGSMDRLTDKVVAVFDKQIARLARRSQELDQETRVSVYLFDNTTQCVVYDKDVLRLPSLKDVYHASGGTALLDATGKAIEDLGKTPELYGEHSFLVYVLTDGEENSSRAYSPSKLSKTIANLPDHWTFAAFVPDQNGVHEAKGFGFPKDNISVWSATGKGLEDAGEHMFKATDNFMENRAKGVRGTRSLLSFDTSGVTKKAVKANLDALKATEYSIHHVRKTDAGSQIRDFVEKVTKKPYRQGSAYYQLTKKENVQSRKNICLREDSTGKIYTGDAVRDMLGLPAHEVRVEPTDHPQFTFFVQSTSVNRKLVDGTCVIVIK